MSRAQLKERAKERVGTLLDGKWTLDALLGVGGSAAVYAASHRNGKRAAIKVLHPHCVEDPQLLARFVREGYLANKIEHPGVVSILDDDTADDGTVYLVMELLEGTALDRHVRGPQRALSLQDGLRVLDEVLGVLRVAHAQGLVHRDIKPGNLFITKDGVLKVLDFGIARLAEPMMDSSTQTGMMLGTPAFMPPEQARGKWDDVDGRTDLWALGATFIALVTGNKPRSAETPTEELYQAMTQPIAPFVTFVPGAPPALAELIDCAVSFEITARWPNAGAMQDALRRLPVQPAQSWSSVTMRLDTDHGSTSPSNAPSGPSGQNAEVGYAGAPPISPLSATVGPASAAHAAPLSSTMHLAPTPAPPLAAPISNPPSYPGAYEHHYTTNRGVLRSNRPMPMPSPASSKVPAILLVLVALGALGGGLAIFAMRARAPKIVTAAASTAPPPPAANPAPAPVDPPPEPASAVDAAPPTTSAPATPSATSSARVATTTDKRPPVARPRTPAPPASTDPTKFLEHQY